MPRRYTAAELKEAIGGGGASSETVPGAAKLEKLLEKVKAPNVSSTEGITRLTLNSINLYRRNVGLEKIVRRWVLVTVVVAGCAFGSGWTYAPARKHLVKEEKMQ